MRDDLELKERVRARYAAAARAAGCCDGSQDPVSGGLYAPVELKDLPPGAVQGSLGCGNPTALAALRPGEVVLDLGSGGGIDVLLSARRVGPGGKAYGLDMTDEMLQLARENQRQAGVTNAEFLKGDIEAIPLPDNHVDVIISNCVVNLAPDKDQVFREAFRTLKPGGRLAIADVVFQGDVSRIPAGLRRLADAWAGCVAGALEEQDYLRRLQAAGFTDANVEITRVYGDSNQLTGCCGSDLPGGVRLASALVRASKPAGT